MSIRDYSIKINYLQLIAFLTRNSPPVHVRARLTPDVLDAHAGTQAKQDKTNEKRDTDTMKRANRSAVWSHFKLVNDDKDAKCTICGSILKYNNSTTSLNNHLNVSHSTVLQAASGSQSQPTITTALGRRVCDSTKAEGITQWICNMITTDLLPINVVDGQGFREVIKYIEPGYNIPSRTTITTRVEASYARKKAEFKIGMFLFCFTKTHLYDQAAYILG